MGFFLQIIIGLVMMVAAFILMPKPPKPKPPSLEDYAGPTSTPGRARQKIFGSMLVKDPNLLSKHDKDIRKRTVEVDKK